MSVAPALREATGKLGGGPSARADAEVLLARAMGLSRSQLLARLGEPLCGPARLAYEGLVARRAAGEPTAYLIGCAGFLDLDLLVTPSVLIPRADTEVLAEWAIERAKACGSPVRVIDVGTGCGALALALASAFPEAEVHATDISSDALAVARRNAERLGLSSTVHLHLADLFPAGTGRFDVVVANLPYVAESERDEMDPEVLRYEPAEAVMAGPDGLDVIRRFLGLLPSRLASEGAAGIEIGWRQGAWVSALASAALPGAQVRVLQDLAGRDRVVVVDARGALGEEGEP